MSQPECKALAKIAVFSRVNKPVSQIERIHVKADKSAFPASLFSYN